MTPARRARRLVRPPLPAALWIAAAGLFAPACGTGDAERPSVVLISIDTLRADHMGVYGYERDTTPYLDRLAEESLVYERAFAPSAWTLISHVTMLTGLYPNQHKVVEGDLALSHRTPLLAEHLSAAGYQTVALYLEGWIHARHGFDRGFDVFRDHADAEEAEEHLAEVFAELDPDRPFFLFLHLFDVHCGPLEPAPGPVYDCPPPYDEMFLAGAADRLPEVGEKRLWAEPGLMDEHALEGLVALYDGGVRYVDDKLARWIEGWKRDGWLDDTLLIVTADHGEALGQHGTVRDHGSCYQAGLHVPMIVRHPRGHRAGERETATVHLVDTVPTVLDFCGLEPDPRLPGRSLLGPIPGGREVYASNPANYEVVVRWPRKFVRLARKGEYLLADLEEDPAELTGFPLSKEEFDEELARFVEQAGAPDEFPPAIEAEDQDDTTREAIQAFGYGGDE